ncbi:MAG: class I SAM-dependent methyltransferase [Novosphingobium sp.]
MRRALVVLSALALSASLAVSLPAPLEAKEKITDGQAMAVVLASPSRDSDRARDQYRHPAQTLSFFKIRPGMTVVDVMPAGGWYSRVLVPFLGERGRYVALNPDVRTSTEAMKKNYGGLKDTWPEKSAPWFAGQTGLAPTEAWNSDDLTDGIKGKVDRAIIMREVHNLWRYDLLRRELTTIHGLLKDDGLLGIEEHRARDKSAPAYLDGSKGYMRTADVIGLIEACGFELVGKSEINANRKDPANWPGGVWTLPPNLSGVTDPAEKARLIEIGESDRMTLLFKKRR